MKLTKNKLHIIHNKAINDCETLRANQLGTLCGRFVMLERLKSTVKLKTFVPKPYRNFVHDRTNTSLIYK